MVTILLVEDNPDDEFLVLLWLKEWGWPGGVRCERDGAGAVDYLRREGAPAAILLDLLLPGMRGLELLRRIRSEDATRNVPVVVLTNSLDDAQIVECYKLGCNSVLRKSGGLEGFQETLRRLGLAGPSGLRHKEANS